VIRTGYAIRANDAENSPEILVCHESGITVTLPKSITSGAKAGRRFGKEDFACLKIELIGGLVVARNFMAGRWTAIGDGFRISEVILPSL